MVAYKVKLKRFEAISAKCFLAEDYNGNTAYIPASQVWLPGTKSNEAVISEWILQQKPLRYSLKNKVFVKDNKCRPYIERVRHKPQRMNQDPEIDKSLFR